MMKARSLFSSKVSLVIFIFSAAALAAPVLVAQVQAPEPNWTDFNSILMAATFKLEGQGEAPGQTVIGTGFLIGRPFPKEPTKGKYVLVTAAHVLDDMRGDTIVVHSRRQVGTDSWVAVPFPLAIRANGRPLFARLPDADVAAIYLQLPSGVTPPLLPTSVLADDDMLKKFAIHPGDEVRCLGYPLGLPSNDAGFPILRSGKIASYPLLPTDRLKTFLLDFKVFKGNSGGPAYFVDSGRTYEKAVHLGEDVQFIVGLISQEGLFEQKISSPYSDEVRRLQLNLGIIVYASQIKKAIDLLPPPEGVP